MLKTIKTTKQMRFDELAKYVWDNDLDKVEAISRSGRFKVKFIDKKVILNESRLGNSPFGTTISLESTVWELEVEEPITEDTVFEWLVKITTDDDLYSIPNVALENIKSSTTKRIYALINGRLELVYERDEDE